MALTRTNITIPEDLLRQIDELAGPRGRSRYIADAVEYQVRRDRLQRVIHETAGAMIGRPGWKDPDEALAYAKRLRASWEDGDA